MPFFFLSGAILPSPAPVKQSQAARSGTSHPPRARSSAGDLRSGVGELRTGRTASSAAVGLRLWARATASSCAAVELLLRAPSSAPSRGHRLSGGVELDGAGAGWAGGELQAGRQRGQTASMAAGRAVDTEGLGRARAASQRPHAVRRQGMDG